MLKLPDSNNTKKPVITVIIVFFNMKREACRTLISLTKKYQLGVDEEDYEVIILDSNSGECLDREWVESLQGNFHYYYIKSQWPTPCAALNEGIRLAKSDTVVCMIDGARILSPGVLNKMILANQIFDNVYVQTIAFHIGNKVQNISMLDGYCQEFEDDLLNSINWETDGYRLFDVSCLALSSAKGYFNLIPECNCFCAPKSKLLELGGFDESFVTPGGGLVNHDTQKRILEDPKIETVMLLGEGTFHQFHGGVATNVTMEHHPGELYADEYFSLRGEKFSTPQVSTFYFGDIHPKSKKFLVPDS